MKDVARWDGAVQVRDAGLVRWANRLKFAGFLFLAAAVVPIFLADPYRRVGGLLLVSGLAGWWLCLALRHWLLARSWPSGSPARRRGLVVAGALVLPLVLLGIAFAWLVP